ncbi:LytTR family DNA-binding domain-containing protein [Polaribacter sp.]|uniref:LytR/AlgR family response regulator transcription factor n=1 Tax=Polaribacter sp. TaxID=1920175 RepID=UPI0025EDA873|nr:LytTR family DNA-binding domain-containing protein [Polaribacter sp.]
MNIVLVDDELFVHGIFEAVLNNLEEVNVIGKFLCPRKALSYLETNDVDLVFLDIQMPDFSGLDFLNEMDRKQMKADVVVTANQDYAVNVINNKRVVYFIKKPLHEYSIKESIRETKEKRILISSVLSNTELLEAKEESSTHTFFNCNRRMINISHDDILIIKSSEGGVYIVTKKEPIVSSSSLKDTDKKLPSSTFMRVHKSYIVNTRKIELIYDNLVIIGKHHVPIGRTYSAKFKAYLSKK